MSKILHTPLAYSSAVSFAAGVLETNPSFSIIASRVICQKGLPGPTDCHSPSLKVNTT